MPREDEEKVAGKIFREKDKMKYDKQKIIKEMSIMVGLSHDNIVKCKGVYFIPSSMLPVIVMEMMMTSLHDYLLNPDNSELPLERKMSFLLDTATGLDYLHSRTPAIIHRDLTAKNVLLDFQLRAKIADFGNSQIMDLDVNRSMTSLPGTPDYMPPEASNVSSSATYYDPSLDVFSFGHLSLFTLIQTPVRPLSAPTYTDSAGRIHGRSEVERRIKLIDKVAKNMGCHSILKIIQHCLHNQPSQRPQTRELVLSLCEIATTGKHGKTCL